MPRRILGAVSLAGILLASGALPGGLSPVAAASCSNWTSESSPPPTIRVFRNATGAVDTVDFRVYAKNVLSREWIGSWTTESLRSGAQAVRNYAWYQVLHWRGGVNADGACFDVRDDTYDQVYDPSQPTWSTAAAAVDDTWSWRLYKNGHIFPTYYNAGTKGEACGANANGWKAYQWGTQACGLAGKTASQILLIYYYPGVTVTGSAGSSTTPTPSATPTPSPTASPSATASATPKPSPTATPTPTASRSATPSPTAAATPTATPHPAATPRPTATPTPTAPPTATPSPTLPPPPTGQQLPGGGQRTVANAAAPPPPPPANPTPVVATPRAGTPAAALSVAGTVASSDADLEALSRALDTAPLDARLALFHDEFPRVAAQLLRAMLGRLGSQDLLAWLFP